MNRWEVPYNLIAYPVGAPGREGVRVVVVPRGEEYCESADQKLAGLEFLTGVLIPGPLRRDGMHAVLRGQAFEEASLGEGARLVFERRLRSVFGMPEAGAAVWPVAASSGVVGGPAYMPRLGANTVFDDPELCRLWQWPPPVPNGEARREANVLVRVTRASICQSDRRVLMGTKKSDFEEEPFVLGHEAGGYVVDPGPWENDLRVGQKVVILPHVTCGACRDCQSYTQNRCERMLHLGFHLHGSLADLMSFPSQAILAVPDDFPDDALPLVEPLSCVLRALFRIKDELAAAAHEPDDTTHALTIFGCGPMGCLTARAVKRLWPTLNVRMVDPDASRRKLATDLGIADVVEASAHNGKSSRISFVASSALQATRDAIALTTPDGAVLLFSGINTTDLTADNNPDQLDADLIEHTHRYEGILEPGTGNPTTHPRLIGSSGYGFDDSARSVSELSRHYDHYATVQNIEIDGLTAPNTPHGATPTGPPTVERYLAPAGINDQTNGHLISKSIKVLVRM